MLLSLKVDSNSSNSESAHALPAPPTFLSSGMHATGECCSYYGFIAVALSSRSLIGKILLTQPYGIVRRLGSLGTRLTKDDLLDPPLLCGMLKSSQS